MILRNVGGLIGDVIPLNLTDRRYIIIEYIIKFQKYKRHVRECWREGGTPKFGRMGGREGRRGSEGRR